jgi:toxin ParE1/3/4
MRARRKPLGVAHKVFFRRRAEDRLTELYDYIASHSSPQTAIDYVARIRMACMALATFPERGRRESMIRKKPALGLDPRVGTGFPK